MAATGVPKMDDWVWKVVYPWVFGRSRQLSLNKFFNRSTPSIRKGRDGKRKKRKEKNGVFRGHYVIASSLPPKQLRPNDDRWNAARSCQNQIILCKKSAYTLSKEGPAHLWNVFFLWNTDGMFREHREALLNQT